MSTALDELKVLEVAQSISGPFCGKLMAAMGAEVIKVEPPEGDPARQAGPFPGDSLDPEASGLFLYLNTGKNGITLNLNKAPAQRLLQELVKDADVLVENHPPSYLPSLGLDYERLQGVNPKLVMVSISPFGQFGPYRDFRATEMVVQALAGELYLAGDPRREPLKKGGHLTDYHGGLNACLGALCALFVREVTGRGQHVDISLQEGVTSIIGAFIQEWVYAKKVSRRRGEEGLPWPMGLWLCKDGYITGYDRRNVDWWSRFLQMTRDEPALCDERFSTPEGRARNVEEMDALFQSWLLERTRLEIYETAQQHGLPFGYVATAPDLFTSPQIKPRDFFVELDHPVAGNQLYPGAPFKLSETPLQFSRAPLLGEHNQEILGGRLGLSKDELAALKEQGVIV